MTTKPQFQNIKSDSDIVGVSLETKKEIADVLGIALNDSWVITDTDAENDLYMIHYTSFADMNLYSDLRGIVVDLDSKTIVARSFGYTPSYTTSSLTIGTDNMYHLRNDSNEEDVYDAKNIVIKPKFEGTLLRVFKHKGKVYHSTHRRLDASRSRWGSSKTFLQMYEELGGPNDSVLFNSESATSPYCHIFLIVHPDVLNVSKIRVQKGFLVYFGPKLMWSIESSQGNPKYTNIDTELRIPKVSTEIVEDGSTIHSPLNISLEDANLHLRYGFYDAYDDSKLDERITTGEACILYVLNSEGQIEKCLQVQSPAYSWRLDMRQNESNLLHRFYTFLDLSYLRTDTFEDLEKYKSYFPILTYHDLEMITDYIKREPIILWMGGTSTQNWLKSKLLNVYNIFMCFIISVPLHKQEEVSQMYSYLLASRNEVISWIQNIEGTEAHLLDSPDLSDRVKNIISVSRSQAQSVINSNRKVNFKDLIDQNIRNLIMKERGSSLYRLVKEFSCYFLTNSKEV